MSQRTELNRRAFLRNAGMAALVGGVGVKSSEAATVNAQGSTQSATGRYDFDTIYSRVGTNSSKWDAQIAKYGREHIEVGMGTADQDFRIAPAITRALRARI